MSKIRADRTVFFERTADGLVTHSVASKLFEKRILMLNDIIEPKMTDDLVGSLLLLNSFDSTTPIELWIHSPGGHVDCMSAIIDIMHYIEAPVYPFAMGQVASAASMILAAGEKGHRKALPNASIMIHQPSGGVHGQASDITIEAEEILRSKKRMNAMLASFTGQPLNIIERDTDRNFYMTPEDAVEYGIIDSIVVH